MRKLLPLLFVCLTALARGQDSPVSWTAGLEKAGANSWTLLVKATVKEGWWLYDHNPKSDIAGPHLLIESGNVGPQGPLEPQTPSVVITDVLFGPGIRVFKSEETFTQLLSPAPDATGITFTIVAIASDGKTFLPVNQEINIAVPQRIPTAFIPIRQPANNQHTRFCNGLKGAEATILR